MNNELTQINEDQIALIIELAIQQRIPATFLEALMAKIHTLTSDEARSVTDSLLELEKAGRDLAYQSDRWLTFWERLASRIEERLAQEARSVEESLFQRLIAKQVQGDQMRSSRKN